MADDSLSDEDKALFREQMRHVTPLKKSTATVKTPCNPPTSIAYRPPNKETVHPKEYFLSDFISEPVLTHTVLSYSHPSVPAKRVKELKNGRIAWEGRLDLHGLRVEEARAALCRFISSQTGKGVRCVLIIHGKGGQEGAPPLIKNLVNRWLPQMDEILAFCSALSKDGGQGAVYVLLKREAK